MLNAENDSQQKELAKAKDNASEMQQLVKKLEEEKSELLEQLRSKAEHQETEDLTETKGKRNGERNRTTRASCHSCRFSVQERNRDKFL